MATTHFGFQTVDEQEKAKHVRSVFDSVAPKYDVMNDLMSAGLHRVWKRYTITVANPQPGQQVLDIAGGTGDLSRAFAQRVGPTGRVVHTDINEAMLREGRNRLLDEGLVLPTMVCDAEKLPFADNSFDIVSVAFGLRNMTHKDQALAEMRRVLKPGGKLLVLEFSRVAKPLEKAYDWYSFNVLPKLKNVHKCQPMKFVLTHKLKPLESFLKRSKTQLNKLLAHVKCCEQKLLCLPLKVLSKFCVVK